MVDYINKLFIKGRIGKTPDVRYMPSGDAVANFSVATSDGKEVEWHPIVAYQKLADRAKSEFSSGDIVYIEGRIKTREYMTDEDRAHNRRPRKIREVIADTLHLVEKNKKAVQNSSEVPENNDSSQPKAEIPLTNNGIPSYL